MMFTRQFNFQRLNIDCDLLKTEANKRLKGDIEAENPSSKKKKASVRFMMTMLRVIILCSNYANYDKYFIRLQSDGPKMLQVCCKMKVQLCMVITD